MESSIKTKEQKEMPELLPELEEKIRTIEFGKVSGKKYTPDEYIKHIVKL